MQTRIHKNTFKGCTKLAHIKLPTGISAIDDEAFRDCASLTKAEIGTDVTFIGLSAFNGCSSLTDVDRFSDTNSSHTFDMVGNHAFANTGLKDIKLALRSDVINTFWGDNCFASCDNLTDVHILSANYLSKEMFKDCKQLSGVKFDVNMMAYMYPKVFENCLSLTSVTLPSKALYIPEEMFKNCTNLNNVLFTAYDAENSGVELILRNAFYGCLRLNEIHIPASINKLNLIEDAALSSNNCSHIIFHGIHHDLFGVYTEPLNILYAVPYYLNDINNNYYLAWDVQDTPDISCIILVLKYAAYHNIPVVITYEFYYKYWPNCNVPIFESVTALTYEEQCDNKYYAKGWPYVNLKGLSNTIVDADNTVYDFSNKKYIILPIYICLGSYGESYDSSPVFTGTILNLINIYLTNTYNNKDNKDYNILTKLWNMKVPLFDMRIISSTTERADYKMYVHIINKWRSTFKRDINKINALSDITEAISGQQRRRFAASTFSDYNNFIYGVNKIIYNYLVTSVETNTIAYDKVPLIPFTPNTNVTRNALFRRITYANNSINVTTSDNITFALTYDLPKPWNPYSYVEPTHYTSDTTTVNNFNTGIWYYNAKELHEHARRTNTPCLFIYSMLGCGPCLIYSKHIWNNASFLDWCTKLNFYLCGIECDSLPFYDTSLLFCSDLSKTAENFINVGESSSMKLKNQFDELFSRIMTPVLIFMDKNGKCYDYTYHSIQQLINSWGVDGVILCLKSLCLYHFDNNDLNNAHYVVEANKIFMIGDYVLLDPDNPWKVADNLMDLSKSNLNTVDQAKDDIMRILDTHGHSYDDIYLGGCLLSYVDYLYLAFISINPDIELTTTADQLNAVYSLIFFRIGNNYYKLLANASNYKTINNPCGDGQVHLFKTTFVESEYIPVN